MDKVTHDLEPVFFKSSKVLILGTMPSVKSREAKFYYAHPQNRFWKTLENVFEVKILDKVKFLKDYNIALWDVLKECEINGSSDNSIKNEVPNDLEKIIKKSQIKVIFTTGKTAHKYYLKYFKDSLKLKVINLPSTSPANCKINNNELIKSYSIIKEYLNNNV